MDNQEVYDKVKAHLFSQNRKSLDANGKCAYRGENGAMCAVGVLIPDAMYLPSMEGAACTSGRVVEVLDVLGIDHAIARDLQKLHDNVPIDIWSDSLAAHARHYGLKP